MPGIKNNLELSFIQLESQRVMLHQQIDKMVVKLKEAKDIERDISGFVNDSNFMTKEEMEAEKERIKTKLQEPMAIQEKVKLCACPGTVLPESLNKKSHKFLKNPKDLHQSNFKISKDLHQRPPKSQKYLHQSSKNYAKNRFKQVFLTIFQK